MKNNRLVPLTPVRRRSAPNPLLLLALLVAALAGALYFLSTLAGEVPTAPIEVDVTNAAGR